MGVVSLTELFGSVRLAQVCFSYPHGHSQVAEVERVVDGIPECLAGPALETDDCVRGLAANYLRGSARMFLSERVVVSMTPSCGTTRGWVGNGTYRPCSMVDLFYRLWEALHGPSLVCVTNAAAADDDDDDDKGHSRLTFRWHNTSTRLARRLEAMDFQGHWDQVVGGMLGGRELPERIPYEHCHPAHWVTDTEQSGLEQALGACSFVGPLLYARCLYQSLLLLGSYTARWLASVMQRDAYACRAGAACARGGAVLGRDWVPGSAKEALETSMMYLLRGVEVCTTKGTAAAAGRAGALVISA